MKSYYPKEKDIKESWYLIDIKDKSLGRVATQIATILRGKNDATFEPSVDPQNFVVVVNSNKLKFTGNKEEQKVYYKHTGFVGGIKEITASKLLQKDSTQIVKIAVKGMLPKNNLGHSLIKKLKVFKDEHHHHEAQKPQKVEI